MGRIQALSCFKCWSIGTRSLWFHTNLSFHRGSDVLAADASRARVKFFCKVRVTS